jgi:hypothetical protein
MKRHIFRLVRTASFGILMAPLLFLSAQQPNKQSMADKIDKRRADGFVNRLRAKLPTQSPRDLIEALTAMQAVNEELRSLPTQNELIYLLAHRDPAVRKEAVRTIGEIFCVSEHASDAFTYIAKTLDDRDVEVRVTAFLALSRMVPQEKRAVPQVLAALKDDDARIRRAAYVVISRAVRYDKALIPHVISALDDPDIGPNEKDPGMGSVSWLAINDLRLWCKAEAKEAAPKLVKIINAKKGSDWYELFALSALASVAPEDRLPLFIGREWVKKSDRKTIIQGIGLISSLGNHAKNAIPDLIEVAKRKPFDDPLEEQAIKIALAQAFQKLGPVAAEALPALEALSTTSDPTLRREILLAVDAVKGKK